MIVWIYTKDEMRMGNEHVEVRKRRERKVRRQRHRDNKQELGRVTKNVELWKERKEGWMDGWMKAGKAKK